MKHEIFALRDNKISAYLQPFFTLNSELATRAVTAVANDLTDPVGKNPEDFALFSLGTYDDSTGLIESTPATHVVNAIDLVKRYDINHENDGE